MKFTEEQIKVLKEINALIPKAWLAMLSRKEWANPVIRKLVDKGLTDPEVDEETKKKLESLKLSLAYSEEVEVIDEKIEKKIDEFLTRQVRKATNEGRLPPLKKEDLYVRKPKEENTKEEVPAC